MSAKKNKAEKRKARLKARKRQAALDLHARNEHLAVALEKLCQPIIPEYIDDSAGIDLVGRKIVYQMGFIAWNIAVTGRGELAAGAFQATRLDAEQQAMLHSSEKRIAQQEFLSISIKHSPEPGFQHRVRKRTFSHYALLLFENVSP